MNKNIIEMSFWFKLTLLLSLSFSQTECVAQCQPIPENVSHIKICTTYNSFGVIDWPRHTYGNESEKFFSVVTSRDDITTFMNVLDTLQAVDTLSYDVYDSGAKIQNHAGRFIISGYGKDNASNHYNGYAIIHWRCKAPEIIWFTPGGGVERDNKRFDLPGGMFDWLIELERHDSKTTKLKELMRK